MVVMLIFWFILGGFLVIFFGVDFLDRLNVIWVKFLVYDELFVDGVWVYGVEKWSEVVEFLEKVIVDYNYEMEVKFYCRLYCWDKYRVFVCNVISDLELEYYCYIIYFYKCV